VEQHIYNGKSLWLRDESYGRAGSKRAPETAVTVTVVGRVACELSPVPFSNPPGRTTHPSARLSDFPLYNGSIPRRYGIYCSTVASDGLNLNHTTHTTPRHQESSRRRPGRLKQSGKSCVGRNSVWQNLGTDSGLCRGLKRGLVSGGERGREVFRECFAGWSLPYHWAMPGHRIRRGDRPLGHFVSATVSSLRTP
jgi:hypothetical protein